MRIDICTTFETSYTENYKTKITARIVTDKDVVLCEGESRDSSPYRASVKEATKEALDKLQRLLDNARGVAAKSGLL